MIATTTSTPAISIRSEPKSQQQQVTVLRYYHEKFLRTRPDLCTHIQRSYPSTNRPSSSGTNTPTSRIRYDPNSEPDFDDFPPLLYRSPGEFASSQSSASMHHEARENANSSKTARDTSSMIERSLSLTSIASSTHWSLDRIHSSLNVADLLDDFIQDENNLTGNDDENMHLPVPVQHRDNIKPISDFSLIENQEVMSQHDFLRDMLLASTSQEAQLRYHREQENMGDTKQSSIPSSQHLALIQQSTQNQQEQHNALWMELQEFLTQPAEPQHPELPLPLHLNHLLPALEQQQQPVHFPSTLQKQQYRELQHHRYNHGQPEIEAQTMNQQRNVSSAGRHALWDTTANDFRTHATRYPLNPPNTLPDTSYHHLPNYELLSFLAHRGNVDRSIPTSHTEDHVQTNQQNDVPSSSNRYFYPRQDAPSNQKRRYSGSNITSTYSSPQKTQRFLASQVSNPPPMFEPTRNIDTSLTLEENLLRHMANNSEQYASSEVAMATSEKEMKELDQSFEARGLFPLSYPLLESSLPVFHPPPSQTTLNQSYRSRGEDSARGHRISSSILTSRLFQNVPSGTDDRRMTPDTAVDEINPTTIPESNEQKSKDSSISKKRSTSS
jgi:hypothetical protein